MDGAWGLGRYLSIPLQGNKTVSIEPVRGHYFSFLRMICLSYLPSNEMSRNSRPFNQDTRRMTDTVFVGEQQVRVETKSTVCRRRINRTMCHTNRPKTPFVSDHPPEFVSSGSYRRRNGLRFLSFELKTSRFLDLISYQSSIQTVEFPPNTKDN